MGKAFVLRGDITTHLLPNDLDDGKLQRTKSQLQDTLRAKFENLFGKMCSYYVLSFTINLYFSSIFSK